MLEAEQGVGCCSTFLCPACFLEKEMVHHFQSLLMMCMKGMWVGVLSKCLLGKEDAFLCTAYISPWDQGRWWQTADTFWHLGGHSWLRAADPQHHQKYLCWILSVVPRKIPQKIILHLKLSFPSVPWIFANSHRDQAGLCQAQDTGVVPKELNVQKKKKSFMWLYVSFNFLVENAVNL